MRRRRVQVVVGLVVTVALLVWALRDVSPAGVWNEALRADPWLLAAAVAVATLAFVPRAVRWRLLLLPVRERTPFDSRFGALCIGMMANNLLPARLGEFARAYAFSRAERMGFSPTLASQVVERAFDGLVLAAFVALVLVLPGDAAEGGGAGSALVRRTAWIGGLVFAAGMAGLWLVARFPDAMLRLYGATLGRLLSPDLTERGLAVVESFLEGLGALHDAGIFVRTALWSVVVWVATGASIWLGFLAFGITEPGFVGALFLQGLIGFAVALPSSPGFFGPFEAAARLGLGLFAVEATRVVSFAVSYHVLSFIPITLLGLWYLRRLGLRWADVERSEEIVGSGIEGEESAQPVPASGD